MLAWTHYSTLNPLQEHLLLHLPPLQYARYIDPAPGVHSAQPDAEADAASEPAVVHHALVGGPAPGHTQTQTADRLGYVPLASATV